MPIPCARLLLVAVLLHVAGVTLVYCPPAVAVLPAIPGTLGAFVVDHIDAEGPVQTNSTTRFQLLVQLATPVRKCGDLL